jgi:transposase
MAIFVRALTVEDRGRLEELQRTSGDEELAKRAAIVLLSAQRKGVHEISAMVGLHPINVRKWIHRFNRMGIAGLYPRRSPGRPRLFNEEQRTAIIGLASTDPRQLGLGFPSWSLQRLRMHLIERGITDEISAETIRQELLRGGLVFEERHWVNRRRGGRSASR